MKATLLLSLIIFTSCSSRQKKISFSFDDAPTSKGWRYSNIERTQVLLKNLKASNIKRAAFYIKTNNLKKSEDIFRIQKYFLAGHMIGNHSHSHQSANKVSPKDYIKDIVVAQKILKQRNFKARYYRYPFLHRGPKPLDLAKSVETLGLKDGYVTVDTYDWYIDQLVKKNTGKKINLEKLKELYLKVILSSIEFYDSVAEKYLDNDLTHVLLLHENDMAALYIGDLAKELTKRGWKFKSPEEAYFQSSIEDIPTAATRHNQGRVISQALAKGYKGPEKSNFETKNEINKLFKEFQIVAD
jgi:peptidoglycan-N-acetylglucosamine deacetylase